MVSITHFSHEHPLLLLKQLPTHEGRHICYGCQEPIIEEGKHNIALYMCESYPSFFLHKSCAELPMEILIIYHDHPLFLLSKAHAKYASYCFCRFCLKYLHGFVYHCFRDNFGLHVKCATWKKESIVSYSRDLTLNHPSHQHTLTTQPRPASFFCDACDLKDEDLSYQCSSCHYLIHRRCAMLPSRTTNHDLHSHPLSLSFSLPAQYHNFDYFCGICVEKLGIMEGLWLYYCELCRYFVHVKCMAIKKPQIKVNLTIVDDDWPSLPMRRKPVDLIEQFLLETNSRNVEQEISICSHKHPLMYTNDKRLLEDEIDDGEEVLCDGCIEPISPPYYYCAECRYFLHFPCAKLPHHLQHSAHYHPLILASNARYYYHFKCHGCNKYSNGFLFRCNVEGCNFNLDVKCAALPGVIEHENHNHSLFRKLSKSWLCNGCGHRGWKIETYNCEYCTFNLHRSCLTLPKTTKHRYDGKHPLTLRFPPHYYHPRPFDCAECEKEINPNFWLYHCEECDLSFHVQCINLSWKSHNSKFGQKLRIISHQHPLKYVFKASVKFPCHGCGRDECDYLCLECETCNFHLCQSCIQKIDPLS